MNDEQIARTIHSQIGGSAMYMLGAKNLCIVPNGLQFRVRGSKRVNLVQIVLNSMDTYDLEFGKIHGRNYSIVEKRGGLYCDQLRQVIEEATGLYTKL